jgi:arylsulfatase A-like enzyme
LNQQELYEREKRIEEVDLDVNPCDESESLTACSSATAISGSRWQNSRPIERMVAGTGESSCRRPALANNGLRYTNFHTTAICAPTRAALLTGRNSSSVHEAGFSHTVMSAGFPGWDGRIPSSAGTIAEILRANGYNTFAVGKYGVTPDEDATDAGPFDRWPTGKGFDHFFGFLGSQTDQYKPDLVEDQAHVRPDGRHLNA